MSKKKPEMTIENCSTCEGEVDIPAGVVSNCPLCGEEIRPCGDCFEECDWKPNGYCIAFPDFRDKEGETNAKKS